MAGRIVALIALGTLVAGCEPMGGMGMGGMGGRASGAGGVTDTDPGSTVVAPGEVVPTDGPGDASDAITGEGLSNEGALDNLDS